MSNLKKIIALILVMITITTTGFALDFDATQNLSGLMVLCGGVDRAYANNKFTLIDESGLIKPFVAEGNTYIPIKFAVETMGGKLDWDDKTKIAALTTKEGTAYYISVERKTVWQKKDEIARANINIRKDVLYMEARQIAALMNKYIFFDEGIVIYSDQNKMLEQTVLGQIKEGLYFERPTAEGIIADLFKQNPNNEHPRLFARSEDFVRIRENIKTDALVKSWYDSVKRSADAALNLPPIRWELRDGIRLLYVSQDVTARVNALAMAYQVEKDPKYAERAYLELKAVGEYPNWTEDHWLDLGQMLHAMAIGYDWIYEYMDEEQRAIVRDSIVKLGLNRYLVSYQEFDSGMPLTPANNPAGWWTRLAENWNPWCNSGAILAALAIGYEEPKLSGYMIERALRSLEIALPAFAPDGGSYEGIGYGAGSTGHVVKTIAGMDSALGTDYGYFNVPGYSGFAYFLPYMVGTNISFNYHDAGADNKAYLSTNFFMANKLNDPALGNMRKNDIENKRTTGDMFDIIWYKPDGYGGSTAKMPLDKYFRKVETGSFRSSWENPEAIWLAFHGGDNSVGHAHLDSGTFVFDAMGLNWALDLGSEPLTYTGTPEQRGDPYLLYRFAPQGHNTLQVNINAEHGQLLKSVSPIIDFESKVSGAFAKMDITAAYGHVANSAIRGYALTDNRTKIVIQDEIELKEKSDVWWSMHTRATIQVSDDGKTAILSQKGKRMRASLVSPLDAEFLSMKAEPLPGLPTNEYQMVNTGIQKLAIQVEDVNKTDIRVEFTPVYSDFDLKKPVGEFVSLADWAISDKIVVLPQLDNILVDGKPIDGFKGDINNYTIPATVGSKHIPVVSVDSKYKVELIQPNAPTESMAQITVWEEGKEEVKNTYYVLFSVRPFQGLPTNGEKVAIDKVTASQEQVDAENKNYATNVRDNDLTTRWSALGEQWIMLELEQTKRINNISIAYYAGETRQGYFDVEISSDARTWKKVYTGESSGATSDFESYPIEPTEGKYVRINCHGNSVSAWNSISEISVFSEK